MLGHFLATSQAFSDQVRRRRFLRPGQRRAAIVDLRRLSLFVVISCCGITSLWGADVHLRNRLTVHGKLHVMDSLPHRIDLKAEKQTTDADDPSPRNICCVDIDWKRVYFPYSLRLAPDHSREQHVTTPHPVRFALPHAAQHAGQLSSNAFKSVLEADPFSEFGLRRVTAETHPTPVHVFQAITEVTPRHVIVESSNCQWCLGMALKTIPIETLDKLLKRQLQWDDLDARLALVRFYVQADFLPKALEELALIKADFPDKAHLIEKRSEDVMDSCHREIQRMLDQCASAGQYGRAAEYLDWLATQPINETIRQDIFQHTKSDEETRRFIENVKCRLIDLETKITDSNQRALIGELNSEICEQLDLESLARLDAFQQAELDKQVRPDQRLSLAHSGWILGSAGAIPDLDQTLKLWVARKLILANVRDDEFVSDDELTEKLHVTETLSPHALQNLIELLPPLLEAPVSEPGCPTRVHTSSGNGARYSVILPAEYSPHHSYPLLIALRSAHRSIDETLALWSGSRENPGLGNHRGYIVISPDCGQSDAETFSYSSEVRQIVLDCLIDARKRYAVDSDRVFLAGHGAGADAAFEIGLAHPDEFAGVLPVGGTASSHCSYIAENACFTAWHVIGQGIDSKGTRDISSDRIFEKMMKPGRKPNFMLVEYLGRDGESATDEISNLFDWMDLHVRPAPPKQFNVCTLSRSNNRFFWVTAERLPRDYQLPLPRKSSTRIVPMQIELSVTPGNTIYLKSSADSHSLRLTPDLVDFQKRLVVRVSGDAVFSGFVKPRIKYMLEELRNRGDRKRLPLAVLAI